MDLPTYTGIWRIEKRLYRLYDFKLPVPVGMRTAGISLGVFAVWIVLLSIIGVPFVFGDGWLLVVWVVPPALITIACTRPLLEGKRLPELAWSYAKFFLQGQLYVRGHRYRSPGLVRYTARVWTRPGTLTEASPPQPAETNTPPLLTRTTHSSPTPGRAPRAAVDSARPLPTTVTPRAPLEPTSPTTVPEPVPASVQVHKPAILEHKPAEPVTPVSTPERPTAGTLILVMGCSSGSGQSVTAHALAHCLPGAAVVSFAHRAHSAALTSAPTHDSAEQDSGPAVFALSLDDEAPTRGNDVAALLAPILHRYPVVLLDPPSTTITPLLPLTDQLVMTSTNNQTGAREAILSTEWLRSAGHELLCEHALAVLTPLHPHPAEPMLSAATLGVRALHVPAWDEGVRTRSTPTTSAETYRELARQVTNAPAHL